MGLNAECPDLPFKNHSHITVVKDMAIVAIHQDEVGLIYLPSSIQVVYQHLPILYKQFLVDVAFFGPPNKDLLWCINATRVMVVPTMYEGHNQPFR